MLAAIRYHRAKAHSALLAHESRRRDPINLRSFLSLLIATLLVSALLSAAATPLAAADPTYSVMNAEGGIYWRSAPDWNTPEATPGTGFYEGTTISVQCYQSGAANVPGSGDSMWEQATDVGGPGTGSGWINEHFINDLQPIDEHSPGVPPCSPGSNQNTPPTTKVSCYGDYCSGKDPVATGCNTVAKTFAAKQLSGARLELRWSPTCKTEWARWIQYSSGHVGLSADLPTELFAVQDTGYTQSASYNPNGEPENPAASSTSNGITTSWTPMIYSPVHLVRAVADVQCGSDGILASAIDCAMNGKVETAAK
jgi:hypothetical protein